ncbi:MAG: hypothetical protein B6I30_05525 [Desulfobacteraceae bacterium 4572_187]|nr:MAG: hypothetical protein B6I30_05525 [Desulfobacteraceae bacterium 4572_187]
MIFRQPASFSCPRIDVISFKVNSPSPPFLIAMNAGQIALRCQLENGIERNPVLSDFLKESVKRCFLHGRPHG